MPQRAADGSKSREGKERRRVRLVSPYMSSTGVPAPSADAPRTVLVIESDVLIRMPLAEYLRECGYRVFEAVNSTEAKLVFGADIEVNLVFANAAGPPGGESGFALAGWVRQHHPETKVLLTSHVADAAHKAADLCESGPMMVKPYSHEGVLRRIRTLLQSR
jgi:DNA-binding response OmpR family regulator